MRQLLVPPLDSYLHLFNAAVAPSDLVSDLVDYRNDRAGLPPEECSCDLLERHGNATDLSPSLGLLSETKEASDAIRIFGHCSLETCRVDHKATIAIDLDPDLSQPSDPTLSSNGELGLESISQLCPQRLNEDIPPDSRGLGTWRCQLTLDEVSEIVVGLDQLLDRLYGCIIASDNMGLDN